MGKTCEPKAFSFQCMTKCTTNKKKKKNYSVRESGGEKNVHTVYLYLDVYV